jgi:hypothetical protein
MSQGEYLSAQQKRSIIRLNINVEKRYTGKKARMPSKYFFM